MVVIALPSLEYVGLWQGLKTLKLNPNTLKIQFGRYRRAEDKKAGAKTPIKALKASARGLLR
jgi:hypothetical protein